MPINTTTAAQREVLADLRRLGIDCNPENGGIYVPAHGGQLSVASAATLAATINESRASAKGRVAVCCLDMREAVRNTEVVVIVFSKFTPNGAYIDNVRLTYCPFCGTRVPGI